MDKRYRTIRYGHIEVSFTWDLDGGGMTFGRQYVEVLRRHLGPVESLFEFCSGPGFIGFAALAAGICQRLTLADISPAAVEACRRTARRNGLEDRVDIYESDCLASIPEHQKWDLVVGNPPHYIGTEKDHHHSRRLFDPGWTVHQKLYAHALPHLNPGANIILQENARASEASDFTAMIEENGLRIFKLLDAEGRHYRGNPRRRKKSGRGFLDRLESVLHSPGIERLIKDNDLYQRLQYLPGLAPPTYFIWSRPAA